MTLYDSKPDKVQNMLWWDIIENQQVDDEIFKASSAEYSADSTTNQNTRILIDVNLDLLNATNKKTVNDDLNRLGAYNIAFYEQVNSIGADFPISKLSDLSVLDYVVSILDADAPIFEPQLDRSIPAIQADYANSLGLTGKGVRIAVLDTGINHSTGLINIAKDEDGKLIQYSVHDESTEDDSVEDYDGHGTHVAGIIASQPHMCNGNLIQGVAPDSEIVPIKVLGGGSGTEDIAKGINWATEQEVDIISMSIGTAYPDNYPGYWDISHPLITQMNNVRTAIERGVIVVISSGNLADNHNSSRLNKGQSVVIPFYAQNEIKICFYKETIEDKFRISLYDPNGNLNTSFVYDNEFDYSVYRTLNVSPNTGTWQLNITRDNFATGDGKYELIINDLDGKGIAYINRDYRSNLHSITIPGNVEQAITVGASSVYGHGNIVDFSSRGPTRNGNLKPDIVAPGDCIFSLVPASAKYPSGHAYKSGTSQAAPHVSGAAALLIQHYREQYNRDLSPAEIKALLMGSAVDRGGNISESIDNDYGAGILNVYASTLFTVADDEVGGRLFPDDDDDCNITVPENAPPWLKNKGMLYWSDSDDDIDLSLFDSDSKLISSSDLLVPIITRMISDNPSAGIWRYTITGKSYGDSGWDLWDESEKWYLATSYPSSDIFEEETGSITNDDINNYYIEVPDNAEYIRTLIYWEDANNNLDIKLYDPDNNLIDNSTLADVSVEQVGIHSPNSGKWRLEINGTSVANPQPYSILCNYQPVECESNSDVSLIIDSSGSMGSNDPSDLRKQAAKMFIDLASEDDQLAVIDFDGSARIWHSLSLVGTSRGNLKTAVDKVDSSGSTDIAAGLWLGYNELNGPNANDLNGKADVLLTDGQSSVDTSSIVAAYVDKGWPIYSIGLSSSAAKDLLEDISSKTGGVYYDAPTSEALQDIYYQIRNLVMNVQELERESGNIAQGESREGTFDVDNSVDEMDVGTSWPGSDLDLILFYPNGSQVLLDSNSQSGTTDSDINFVSSNTYEIYKLRNPPAGVWKYRIDAIEVQGSEPYTFTVSAVTSTKLLVTMDETEYSTGEFCTITADFFDEQKGISNASIGVEVICPDLTLETFDLVEVNDGAYKGESPAFEQPGLYHISVKATNDNIRRQKTFEIDAKEVLWANFDADCMAGSAPLAVNFSDLSTGNPTACEWDFGDGTPTSVEWNPVHEYNAAGSYNVTLRVWDATESCISTKEHFIQILDASISSISVEKFTNGYDADTDALPSIPIGNAVEWVYVINNTGDIPLFNIKLEDDVEGEIMCPSDTLLPGESMQCLLKGTSQYGHYVNIVYVSGESNGIIVNNSDTGEYYGYDNSGGDYPVAVPTAHPIITASLVGIFGVVILRRSREE
ncbi:S8 family serine peptidase [Methanolobus sp. ZRKC5]|uniref:S8 family serine peptidase n=1 Tax=unclassified Methanolobus TaxID=2629569 RepID=UPI00313CEB39